MEALDELAVAGLGGNFEGEFPVFKHVFRIFVVDMDIEVPEVSTAGIAVGDESGDDIEKTGAQADLAVGIFYLGLAAKDIIDAGKGGTDVLEIPIAVLIGQPKVEDDGTERIGQVAFHKLKKRLVRLFPQ